jgi:hypothetical protein
MLVNIVLRYLSMRRSKDLGIIRRVGGLHRPDLPMVVTFCSAGRTHAVMNTPSPNDRAWLHATVRICEGGDAIADVLRLSSGAHGLSELQRQPNASLHHRMPHVDFYLPLTPSVQIPLLNADRYSVIEAWMTGSRDNKPCPPPLFFAQGLGQFSSSFQPCTILRLWTCVMVIPSSLIVNSHRHV